ncbi:MAG: HAD-IC family P-type ATPase [Deltaproteobacteria bacterium]|nr:HAD-IC family P-type ATPase [Deltaproteobacteria bacterium]
MSNVSGQQVQSKFERNIGCQHCGLVMVNPKHGKIFCCFGCENAYGLIHGLSLARYYDLKTKTSAPVGGLKASPFELGYSWIDKFKTPVADRPGYSQILIDFPTIVCAGCVWLIETLVARQGNGVHIELNPARKSARIVWEESKLQLDELLGLLEKVGYRGSPYHSGSDVKNDMFSMMVVRFGILTVIAVNSMLISICFYLGLTPADGLTFSIFRLINFLLATTSMLVGAPIFIVNAYRAIRNGVIHSDLPIAVAMVLAYVSTTIGFLFDFSQTDYFDTLNIFIALMVLGRLVVNRVTNQTSSMLALMNGTSHLTVTRVGKKGVTEDILATELCLGDRIVVAAGSIALVNGYLLGTFACGFSSSFVNGETAIKNVKPGQEVLSGSVNESGFAIELEVTETVIESQLHKRLTSSVDVEPHSRDFSWNFSGSYVIGIFVLATMTVVANINGSVSNLMERVTAVLVVACPCAFGIVPALVYEISAERLRRIGVFVRNGRLFRNRSDIKDLVFDKTGTLTRDGLVVENFAWINSLPQPEIKVLCYMASRSSHPIAKAITRDVGGFIDSISLEGLVAEITGCGLELCVGGTVWRLGKSSWALKGPVFVPGREDTVFSKDGKLCTIVRVKEDSQENLGEILSGLKKQGFRLHLASGDNERRVQSFVRKFPDLFTSVSSGLLYYQKRSLVEKLGPERVAFIGDGLNDIDALEYSAVSISPGFVGSTMGERADVLLADSTVGGLSEAFRVSNQGNDTIKRSFAIGAIYNVVAVAFAMQGLITPLVAAIIMPLSSIGLTFYTVWSLRVIRFQDFKTSKTS